MGVSFTIHYQLLLLALSNRGFLFAHAKWGFLLAHAKWGFLFMPSWQTLWQTQACIIYMTYFIAPCQCIKGFYWMHMKCNGTNEFVRNLHVVLYQEVIWIFFSRNVSLLSPFAGVLYMPSARSRVTSCRLPLQAILLSSDGHNLVTGGDNGVVQVWQACDFKQLYVYPGCDAGVRAMDLSHDQRWEQPVGLTHHRRCRGERAEAKHHRWGTSREAGSLFSFISPVKVLVFNNYLLGLTVGVKMDLQWLLLPLDWKDIFIIIIILVLLSLTSISLQSSDFRVQDSSVAVALLSSFPLSIWYWFATGEIWVNPAEENRPDLLSLTHCLQVYFLSKQCFWMCLMRVTQCSVFGRIRQACVFVCVHAVAVCACVGSLRRICIRLPSRKCGCSCVFIAARCV